MYPDVVAQCVYSTFIHAYPTSWNSFDDEFKTELCQIISLWQVGTKPLPNSWKKWELKLLEPPNLLKHVVKEEQKLPTKSPRRGTFDLDGLIKEAREGESEVAAEKPCQVRQHESATSSTDCPEPPEDVMGENKHVTISDIEVALYSTSTLQTKQEATFPRSTTASRRASMVQKSASKERMMKERAKQQLDNLKRVVKCKPSNQTLQQMISIQEQKWRISQNDNIFSSLNSTGCTNGILSTEPNLQRSSVQELRQTVSQVENKRGSSTSRPSLEAKPDKIIVAPVVKQSSKQKTTVTALQKPNDKSQRKDGSQRGGKKVSTSSEKSDCGKNDGKTTGSTDVGGEIRQTWKEMALALCARQRKQDVRELKITRVST